MRIAVLTDIHSNLEAFQAVLADIEKQDIVRTICLGDIAGYNANPNECIEIVRKKRIDSIMGNHDAVCCRLEEPWFFRSAAKAAAVWTAGVLTKENQEFLRQLPNEVYFNSVCFGVHGSPTGRDEYMYDWLDAVRHLQILEDRKVKICFFGHSHIPSFFSETGMHARIEYGKKLPLSRGAYYFINFGSVGQPRDSDPRAAYGIVEFAESDDRIRIEFRRVAYDIDTACRKIEESNLPDQLSRRLRGRFIGSP